MHHHRESTLTLTLPTLRAPTHPLSLSFSLSLSLSAQVTNLIFGLARLGFKRPELGSLLEERMMKAVEFTWPRMQTLENLGTTLAG